MNTSTPIPDPQNAARDLASVAHDAAEKLCARALIADCGREFAARVLTHPEFEIALRTVFSTGRPSSAVSVSRRGATACIDEFGHDDPDPSARAWAAAVWQLCTTAFERDGGRHGSVAQQDRLLDGLGVVEVRASFTPDGFAMRGALRSHGAEVELFRCALTEPPAAALH